MLIDLILDRKDGQPYNAKKFYDAVTSDLDTFPCYIGVARALDGGTEADVITELCDYIKSQDYNLDLCEYISSVKWLEDDEPEKTEQRSVTSLTAMLTSQNIVSKPTMRNITPTTESMTTNLILTKKQN